MFDKDILTIDVDWASDKIIEDIAEFLLRKKVKATWFITHNSPAIEKLKDYPDYFERGIHPNCFEGSTHGKTYEEVLDFCLSIVPEAVSTRSHGVYQNGAFLSHIARNTPLKIDSTIFLPEMPGLYPLEQPFVDGSLIKAPFFWADDYEICLKHPFQDISRLFKVKGMRIYMFHPIHIGIDTVSWDDYQARRHHESALKSLNELQKNGAKGVASAFFQVVEYLSQNGCSSMLKSILDN